MTAHGLKLWQGYNYTPCHKKSRHRGCTLARRDNWSDTNSRHTTNNKKKQLQNSNLIMDEKKLFIADKVFSRYYRVSVSGSMPEQTGLKIDAWTMATERPQGSHVVHDTDVNYEYWLTMDELADKFNADPLIISDAVKQMCESENFFDSLFDGPKHDESYENIYFRVLVDDAGCFDIDGCVKTETKPGDSWCCW